MATTTHTTKNNYEITENTRKENKKFATTIAIIRENSQDDLFQMDNLQFSFCYLLKNGAFRSHLKDFPSVHV